jgi:stage II sporulation protein D
MRKKLKFIIITLIVVLVIAGIPALSLFGFNGNDFFLLKDENGTTSKISEKDYICGVINAELPGTFEDEAIKAVAVAAYTLALRRQSAQGFITADSNTFQAYRKPNKSTDKFKKIKRCVDAVYGEILVYGHKPILAAYHAMSSGKTENCGDIWMQDLPYLKSVDSSFEQKLDGFEQTLEMVYADFLNLLEIPETDRIEIKERTAGGTVKELTVGESTFTGSQIRELLSLRSANFDIQRSENLLRITTRGFGHGVGLSQYGANSLAASGKNYKEILGWYYTDVEIIRRN